MQFFLPPFDQYLENDDDPWGLRRVPAFMGASVSSPIPSMEGFSQHARNEGRLRRRRSPTYGEWIHSLPQESSGTNTSVQGSTEVPQLLHAQYDTIPDPNIDDFTLTEVPVSGSYPVSSRHYVDGIPSQVLPHLLSSNGTQIPNDDVLRFHAVQVRPTHHRLTFVLTHGAGQSGTAYHPPTIRGASSNTDDGDLEFSKATLRERLSRRDRRRNWRKERILCPRDACRKEMSRDSLGRHLKEMHDGIKRRKAQKRKRPHPSSNHKHSD